MMKLLLLGRTELVDSDGHSVTLPTKKGLLLLAILAMNEDKSLSREVLCEAIWPQSEREARRSSLRNALVAVRRVLSPAAIIATGDTISFVGSHLTCDARMLRKIEDYTGDFMPGFDDDWVLDERLRLRQIVVNDALVRAETLSLPDGLKLVETACEIDPLNQELAEYRIQLLSKMGRTAEAAQASSTYQVRVLKKLGIVCDISPEPKSVTEQSPLFATGEWLIERNPEEAISFLASTRSTWVIVNGARALDLHEKALQASAVPSLSRRLVQAQRLYLMWIVGKFSECLPQTQLSFEEAVLTGEIEVATILGNTLTYGLLSRGQFDLAIRYAKETHTLAASRKDPIELLRAERNMAIIEQHVGHISASDDRIRRSQKFSDATASADETALHNVVMAGVNIRAGRLDDAALCLSQAKRYFEANNGMRMVAYTMLGKAELLFAAGDYSEALEVLEGIRQLGQDVMGHSLAASIDDLTGQLFAKLREFDVAAESLARSTLLRRRLGAKASIYESSALNPARRLLKEKLDEREIRAAFGRAKLSFTPPAI